MMSGLMQDLKYAIRMLTKNPAFTAVAALTLGLGIGANGAIFGIANALLLRPIVAPEADELVRVYAQQTDGRRRGSISYPDYRDYRDFNQTLAGLAATSTEGMAMTAGGQTELLLGEIVSGNYFDVLKLRPALGRFFRSDEDHPGAGRVVVLGHRFWQRRFGGRPETLGTTILLNGQGFTVIGIAPEEFSADSAGVFMDVWVPLRQSATLVGAQWVEDRASPRVSLIGRRKPGVATAQAQADLGAIAARLAGEYPQIPRRETMLVEPARFFDSRLRTPVAAFLGVMMGLGALVLLTACANLANFLLARATERRREMAVRMALGAGRWRLMRQLYCESLLVALLGGAAGLVLAAWAGDWLSNYNPLPATIPIRLDFSPDVRVYLATALAAVAAGLLLGVLPARQSTRPGVLAAVKEESTTVAGGRSSARSAFLVAQVALSLVLLIGAGLFLRSLRNAGSIPLGFEPGRVLAMDLDASGKNWSEERVTQYYRDLVRRVESLPGVERATLVNLMPADLATPRFGVEIPGQEQPPERGPLQISMNRIGVGYFEALRIPLVSGRDFRETDAGAAPGVAIINQTFAGRYWPGRDPVGQRFRLAPGSLTAADQMVSSGQWVEVVGVARDVKYRSLGEEPEPHMYLPYAQHFAAQRTLVVRAAGDPGPMIGAVQNELRAIDPELPGFFARTGVQHLGVAFLPARMAATLSLLCGALALLLAVLGLYGVVAWSVAQRTREIGIRMALGAARSDVLALVVGQGMKLVGIGIAVGLAGSLALTRFLAALLYGVNPTDPLVFAGVATLLAAVAAAASYLPARRASRVDPMVALRYQ